MKCPNCKRCDLIPAKKPGFYSCPSCGFLFDERVNRDSDSTTSRYDVDTFRCKDGEPPLVFQKARDKFNNDKFEVVGLRLERGDYSLLFGQRYTVLKRRK
ncbi:MAG: hypothetical protein MJ227_04480 [Bacilli bacterium]|nr:hypothetical protein [Bacilli bacterium]